MILCRDLPLAPLSLAVGRSLKIPVVLDISEHYPGVLADLYNMRDFRVWNLLVRNPFLAAWLERMVVPRAAAVIVVVEEMARRLESMGVDRDRITIVSNTPPADRLKLMTSRRRRERAKDQPLRLVYVGNIERPRGLDVVVKAVAHLASTGVTTCFEVFGDGKDLGVVKRLATHLGVDDRVVFHGRRPYEEILARLADFDAGVIPHYANDQCSFTVPNKLFDYMAAGLPVIVSAMPPSARIVRTAGAGSVFRDRDPHDLARVLRTFPAGKAALRMGDAGRRAVLEKYLWEQDAARLVATMEQVARRSA